MAISTNAAITTARQRLSQSQQGDTAVVLSREVVERLVRAAEHPERRPTADPAPILVALVEYGTHLLAEGDDMAPSREAIVRRMKAEKEVRRLAMELARKHERTANQ